MLALQEYGDVPLDQLSYTESPDARPLAAAGMSDRIATTEVRQEGFYWVILGQNPPEIAYWERGEWWLAGDAKPWHPEAVTVVSDRLVFSRD